MTDQTLTGSSESILLAAQAPPTSPINVTSTATVVPAPTASQFGRDLESMQVAEALVGMREGPSTAQAPSIGTTPLIQYPRHRTWIWT